MKLEKNLTSFESMVLPHLDAAYNLARWLTHNDNDAQDVVQEACLRAYRGFATFHGGEARAWLLTVVRNSAFDLRKRAGSMTHMEAPEEVVEADRLTCEPSAILSRIDNTTIVRRAIELLPVDYREVIVLRELQGMSYKEIAGVIGVPMGTVMSRLSRGRRMLHETLAPAMPDMNKAAANKKLEAARGNAIKNNPADDVPGKSDSGKSDSAKRDAGDSSGEPKWTANKPRD